MTNELKWILFRGIVCDLLDKHEYIGGDDKWDFATSLDMSFEGFIACNRPIEEWDGVLNSELLEYKAREGKTLFLEQI